MNAEIITIGDELLLGQVIDTNSAFLASELSLLGIRVIQITSVPDHTERIKEALAFASKRAELIICTGGLGPTSDDITKQSLAAYFNTPLIINPYVVDNIREFLEKKGEALNDRNLKQAELPENCEVIHNSCGTAQGMWFIKDGKNVISLPGVPYEMKAIWIETLRKTISERFTLPPVQHFTILTHGIPESRMADMIHDWEEQLPENLKLAYLPSPGILRLRITATGKGDPFEVQSQIQSEVKKIEPVIGSFIFGYNTDYLESVIGKLLSDNHLTVSTAESCTGGLISSMITSVQGSSAYFKGGVVAYSNEIKTSELSVSPYTILMNGAVSQAVVEQMADGARNKFNTDFSVAVSGIAGPDGGSQEKPVGTTWIAIASKKRIVSGVHNFGDERNRNNQKAAIAALFMLRKEVLDCL